MRTTSLHEHPNTTKFRFTDEFLKTANVNLPKMRGTSSLLLLVLSSLIFIIMITTPANALGKIEQTYVGGNDATELVRAFNAWIDENDGENWSKVVVKEFPGTSFSLRLSPQINTSKKIHTNSIPPRSRG